MKCPKCPYQARSIGGLRSHLSSKHPKYWAGRQAAARRNRSKNARTESSPSSMNSRPASNGSRASVVKHTAYAADAPHAKACPECGRIHLLDRSERGG